MYLSLQLFPLYEINTRIILSIQNCSWKNLLTWAESFGKQLINCIALSQVTDSVTDLEFTVPDLLQGKEYLFKVCARNKCGPGEPAYVDEPVNMSAPVSEYILDNFLPNLLLPVFIFIFY